MSGPLAGLQIIEMAGLGPCPLAGQLLADLGADVIVIDRAESSADPTDVNRRGKRSVVLDLKSDTGRATAAALINKAGLVIEGFRPGVMERLGLGPDDLEDHVIFGRITGWGQTGPMAQMAGHDINYLGLTGALAAMGPAEHPPVPPLNLVADYGGGTMFLLFGVLAAIFERQRSGKGQVVDAAMIDGVSSMMGLCHTFFARGEFEFGRNCNLLDGGAPFYRTYETADGKFMAVGPLESQFHNILLEKAGLPVDHSETQNDRSYWADRSTLYAAAFRSKTQSQWVDIFDGTDACVTPVLDLVEAAAHPHMQARDVFFEHSGVTQSAPAPRFSRSSTETPGEPVAAGANTEEILAELKSADIPGRM